ncbi:hypothetical protein [Thermomonas sp. HDW16]|uniref:hypothetical protein n=1 Tax=Thermomonas sp. HDW16 TaxID=2714945 RepID=UPI001407E34D|nr:hypothetical protein [Thermomonas sp. HDW16]QIL20530.1 hypothetical protein G7079_07170 [Thermomonas sp. HDW16]
MDKITANTSDNAVIRLNYARPMLTILGDIRALTETGSMVGAEDSDGNNGSCNGNINNTFNMC